MKRNIGVGLLLTVLSLTGMGQTKSAFVAMLGEDTLAVEEYSMNGGALTGVSIIRSPQTTVRTYRATFGPNGQLEKFHVEYQPYGKPVGAERDYLYYDDSIHIVFKQGETVRQVTSPVSGRPFPFFENLFGGWSVAIQQTMNQGKPGFGILGGRRALEYVIQKGMGNRVDLLNDDFGPIHVVMGKDGEFSSFDMRATTDKYVVHRVAALDIKAAGDRFAANEQVRKGMGVLSPRDSAKATVNGGHVMIDYGRPSARGRKVFGNIVPWNEVWRTGANSATQLFTDKTIMIGGTMIPSGTYSLFTLPSEKGWMLIVNSQHGQWGTQYDQTKDVVRVPLELKQLPDMVEQFVFEIVPQSGMNATLVYRWEHTQASADFMVH